MPPRRSLSRRCGHRFIRRSSIGLMLALSAVGVASYAKQRTRAAPLTGEKLYIAKIVGNEKSEGRDRVTPARLARAITTIDIDHDGIVDYQVDYGKAVRTLWCGTGGCDLELWRGRRGGHPVRVWEEMVRERKIAHRGGEIVFDFDFHGSACGTFGAEACPASFAWDAKAGRMMERATPTGDTTARLIDPLPLTRAQVPTNILAVAHAATAKCEPDATSDDGDFPVSIPDIDGDGIRDWSLTVDVCEVPGDLELQQLLFATAGDTLHPVVAASGVRFKISFGAKPASVAQVDETQNCEIYSTEPDAKICADRPMVWNAATRKLDLVVTK